MRFSGQIRDTHVLIERMVRASEVATREEIIETFKYQIAPSSVDNNLKRLELDGKVKYSPRDRTFTWQGELAA